MYGPFLTVPDAQKLAGPFIVSVWKCSCVCVLYPWASVIVQHLCVFGDKVMLTFCTCEKESRPLTKTHALRETAESMEIFHHCNFIQLTQPWAFKWMKTSLSSLTSSCVNALLCHVCAIVCWTHKDWIEIRILIILPNLCTAFIFTFSRRFYPKQLINEGNRSN